MNDIRPDSAPTIQLIESAASGDRSALGQLLQRHLPTVKLTVFSRLDRRLRSRVDPSDVVQETQLQATKRFQEFLSARPMPFHLWLRREAHQQLLKAERRHLQTAKRSLDREIPLPDQTSLHLVAAIARQGSSPASRLHRTELAAKVRHALADLSEQDREVIMLRNYEGLSNGEAACLLAVSDEAAKKRYTRALLRLQYILRDHGITGGTE